MWLFDIIKNGDLVDNQNYVVNQGEFTNNRWSKPVTLFTKSKRKRNNPYNNEEAIWNFLNSVSRDVESKLKNKISDSIILFNDEDYEQNTDNVFFGIFGTDARNFTLSTGNLIGYVKGGDYSLKISSRFGDSFLQYMIADADGFLELENTGGESHGEGYEWLLAYLWNIKFKRAYRLGLPKTYITKHDRISCVRGTIDVPDYFRFKTSGKFLCSYREQSYNNPATSLFIKVYETVGDFSFCHRTRNIYNAFLTVNQGMKRSRQEILRTPYFTNPFYRDYNVLIDLSKLVIRQQGSNFDSQNDASAYFFDISMLFEYLIRKLFKRNGIPLLNKFELDYRIPAGGLGRNMRKLEPDLVIESDGGFQVFDVKYKAFDQYYGVRREDLFQLHTYIGQIGNRGPINGCGFIYPISEAKWNSLDLEKSQGVISDNICQQGKLIPFHVLFLKIPNGEHENFTYKMKHSCQQLIGVMKEGLKTSYA
ncbi:MAG: hypothetical protein OXH47_03500 [Paracoccaceae bacterium]|nr:hypothetical protein [Paracoccaceae bacterium]